MFKVAGWFYGRSMSTTCKLLLAEGLVFLQNESASSFFPRDWCSSYGFVFLKNEPTRWYLLRDWCSYKKNIRILCFLLVGGGKLNVIFV